MPKAALIAFGRREVFHDLQLETADLLDYHLGDAITALDRVRLRPQIDQGDFNFTPVIGIDGARRIDESDAMLHRQAAPRPDLCFVAGRQGHGKPGRDKGDLPHLQSQGSGHGCMDIHPGGLIRHIAGKRNIGICCRSQAPKSDGGLVVCFHKRHAKKSVQPEGVFKWRRFRQGAQYGQHHLVILKKPVG